MKWNRFGLVCLIAIFPGCSATNHGSTQSTRHAVAHSPAQDTGITPATRSSLTASFSPPTPFPRYDSSVLATSEQRWHDLLANTSINRRSGTVVLRCSLMHDGRVADLKILKNTMKQLDALLRTRAVTDPSPFPSWPPDMRRALAGDYRRVTLTFIRDSDPLSSLEATDWAAVERSYSEADQRVRREANAGRQQESRESYLKEHPEIPETVRGAISRGQILLGMRFEHVRASWGAPERISRTASVHGAAEQWTYGNVYLDFENGALTAWHESQ